VRKSVPKTLILLGQRTGDKSRILNVPEKRSYGRGSANLSKFSDPKKEKASTALTINQEK
jgi:hypothetical protein